jgi:hypothetical protein
MKKFFLAAITTSLFIGLFSQPISAQSRRPPGVDSLAEQNCRAIEGNGGFAAINDDVPVGRSFVTAIAVLGMTGWGNEGNFDTGGQRITTNRPLEVVCSLAGSGETPTFRTLNLAFGFRDDGAAVNNSTRIRLSIFLDGNSAGSQTILAGDQIYWPIDISNKRSISLRADCFGPSRTWCPNVYFFQDTLAR